MLEPLVERPDQTGDDDLAATLAALMRTTTGITFAAALFSGLDDHDRTRVCELLTHPPEREHGGSARL